MKELAVVKLTKSIFGKVGEKIKAKKKVWAEQAAISVEENKRREAEFKADFSSAKEKINVAAIKEEIQKGVEATSKKVESLQTKGVKAEDVTKGAVKEAKKVAKPLVEKESKEVKTKPAPKKEAVKVVDTKKSEEKSAPKTVAKVSKTETVKTDETAKEKTTSKSVEKSVEKKPAVEKVEPKKAPVKVTEKKEAVKATATKKKADASAKPATKREEKLALYSGDITKHYGKVDEDFLAIIVKNLGPSIYKRDSELVSCSDPKELATVKNNFLVKKLKMKESDDVLDGAIKEVCEELKASRNKYRATFYYALAKKFKQESKLK